MDSLSVDSPVQDICFMKGAQVGGMAHDIFIRDDTTAQTVLITARSAQVRRAFGRLAGQ